MKRVIGLISLVLITVVLIGCAGTAARRRYYSPPTSTVIQSWAGVWLDYWSLNQRWPAPFASAEEPVPGWQNVDLFDHDQVLSGNLLKGEQVYYVFDEWFGDILVHTSPGSATSLPVVIIASAGPDGRFNTDLRTLPITMRRERKRGNDDFLYYAVPAPTGNKPAASGFLP